MPEETALGANAYDDHTMSSDNTPESVPRPPTPQCNTNFEFMVRLGGHTTRTRKLRFHHPDSSGWAKVKVTVKNNSSKTSNYSIEIVAESADGTEMFDWAILSMRYVAPGQMATGDSIFTDAGRGYVCRLREVQRLAAN